ncbi:MAG: gliding motility-associated C-terminal domain-containing protein, partial [Bacteroidales bacterium]
RTTQFIVSAENEDNCVTVDTVTVEVDELQIDTYIFDQISCYGETDGRIYVSPIGTEPYVYEWENGHTGQSRMDLNEGLYSVTVTDDLGCENSRDFEIIEPEPLQITDTTINFVTCSTACNGSIHVKTTGGTKPYTYSWSHRYDTTASIHNLCLDSEYTVNVTDKHGCKTTVNDTIHIGMFASLPYVDAYADDYNLYEGQTTTIHAAPEVSDTINYKWTPQLWLESDTSGVTETSTPESITYYVYATDQYGCMSQDTVSITVHEWECGDPYIFVPTAFSPNDDGVNDILEIKSDVITDISFEIYDRWGECVFSTTELDATWDGTYKGEKLHPQVLVYYIKARCLNEEEFVQEGNITILE